MHDGIMVHSAGIMVHSAGIMVHSAVVANVCFLDGGDEGWTGTDVRLEV